MAKIIFITQDTFTMKYKYLFGTLLIATALATASAQSVFTPSTELSDYKEIARKTLVADEYIYYMCIPAFTNPYALSMNDSTFVYITVVEDKSQKHQKKAFSTQSYELEINAKERTIFRSFMDAAAMSSNFYDRFIGKDGVYYYLYEYGKQVKVWSPRKGSRTKRAVHALDSLCYAVEHSDRAVLKRQLDTCRTLTKEFRNLYPLSFFRPSDKGYVPEERQKTLIFSGFQDSTKVMKNDKWYYYIGTRCIQVQIVDFTAKKVNRNALCDSLTAWNREMYINHVQDIWPRQMLIDVNDTTVARCEVYSSRPGNSRILYLPAEQLKHDIIFNAATLSDGFYLLSPTGEWQPVSREDYERQKKHGQEPVFDPKALNIKNADFWENGEVE